MWLERGNLVALITAQLSVVVNRHIQSVRTSSSMAVSDFDAERTVNNDNLLLASLCLRVESHNVYIDLR